MKNPKYEIRKSKDKQFYFILKAENGKIILKSEMYHRKAMAIKGIKAVQKNSTTPKILDTTSGTLIISAIGETFKSKRLKLLERFWDFKKNKD